MTIQDWGSIGEMLGAVGVILTLLYLAAQVRMSREAMKENLLALRAQAKQASTRIHSDFMETQINHPELQDIFFRSMSEEDADNLTENDFLKLSQIYLRGMMHFNDDHYRLANKLLGHEEWEDSYRLLKVGYLDSKHFRQWWKDSGRELFGDRFRFFIDSECERKGSE